MVQWVGLGAALFSVSVAHGMELGDPVEESIAVHLTPDGLAKIGDLVEALLPKEIVVESGEGTFECAEDDLKPLQYSLDELTIRLSADTVELNTLTGALELDLFASIWSDPGTLSVKGDCSILQDLDEVCGIELPLTAMAAHLSLTVEESGGKFDVSVSSPEVEISPMGNPLSDCTPASAVGTLLGQDESYLSMMILSMVEPELAGMAAALEQSLESAFGQLTVSTEVAIGDNPVGVTLYPTLIQIDEVGMVLGLGAQIDVSSPSDCVDWRSGFVEMGTGWPVFSTTAAGTTLPYHSGLFVGRDFVDQLLFSIWASGALCLEVSDLNGASLTAGLLNTVMGPDLEAVVDPDATATLVINPRARPLIEFSDDDPVFHLLLDDLALDLVTELEERTLRIFEVGITGDVGLSIELSTEQLATELVLDDGTLDYRDNWTDLAAPGYSEGIGSIASVAITTLLPQDLLPTVQLPSLLGIEIDAVVWLPTEDEAWQGGYLLLDTSEVEPIVLEGCAASDLGCDGGGGGFEFDLEEALGCTEGGDLGCAEDGAACAVISMPPLSRVLPTSLLLLGVLLRRRSWSES
jgi:hypothetical protein